MGAWLLDLSTKTSLIVSTRHVSFLICWYILVNGKVSFDRPHPFRFISIVHGIKITFDCCHRWKYMTWHNIMWVTIPWLLAVNFRSPTLYCVVSPSFMEMSHMVLCIKINNALSCTCHMSELITFLWQPHQLEAHQTQIYIVHHGVVTVTPPVLTCHQRFWSHTSLFTIKLGCYSLDQVVNDTLVLPSSSGSTTCLTKLWSQLWVSTQLVYKWPPLDRPFWKSITHSFPYWHATHNNSLHIRYQLMNVCSQTKVQKQNLMLYMECVV